MTRDDYLRNPSLYARRGTDCNAKLDDKTVAWIKRQHARKQKLVKKLNDRYGAKGLAQQLGLHVRTVERILQRSGWVHVD